MANVTVDHGGRGGNVIWQEGDVTLRFCWEGANFGFEVGVPTRTDWTEHTGLPESRRDEVIRALGEAFIEARAPRGHWVLVELERWCWLQIHPN
jgi:hypothetical protein